VYMSECVHGLRTRVVCVYGLRLTLHVNGLGKYIDVLGVNVNVYMVQL
jgi:hypothetical protein